MVFSIIVTTALVAYQRRVVRLTGSTAIRADSLHYAADIVTNIGVIVALALAMTVGWGLADPIIAMLIAGVIIHAAVRVGWGRDPAVDGPRVPGRRPRTHPPDRA